MAYIKDGCYCSDDYKDDYRDDCKDKDTEKEKDCCIAAKHPKPKKILLECGFCPQDAIFDVEECYSKHYEEFILDKVLVDTTCLCRPQVKIEFSSLVFLKRKANAAAYKK